MLLTLVAALTLVTVSAQNFQSLPPASAPVRRGKTIIIPLPKDASGEDVYPDCNKGKVCLPEAAQCAQRQQKAGATQYEGKTYWFSWQVEYKGCFIRYVPTLSIPINLSQSDEEVLRKAKWNWFTARNYCRKRCMDLVRKSFCQE